MGREMSAMTRLVGVMTLLLSALLLAQEPQDPKRIWDKLSPSEREALEHRFELWKKLPSEQQAKMRARHGMLRDITSEPQGPVSMSVDQVRVEENIQNLGSEILKASGWTADEVDALSPDELLNAARKRALDRVHQLEKKNRIDAATAQRLRELPPSEFRHEIKRIEKSIILANPPRAVLELPSAERARLEALPPTEFLREIKRLAPPPPGTSPGEPGPRGPRAPRVKPLPNPRILSVRKWLDNNADPGELAALRKAEPFERRRMTREYLQRRARFAVEARGGSAEWLNEVELLPNEEREIRLIQLIDPTFVPPPPPPHDRRD
jgi:Protein of unknown function (DUF3106)